jgi:hypothetical protein
MKISVPFELDLPEIEEDYPDQQREFHAHLLRDRLVSFIYAITDKFGGSIDEAVMLRFTILVNLLNEMQTGIVSRVLAERVRSRMDPTPPTRG